LSTRRLGLKLRVLLGFSALTLLLLLAFGFGAWTFRKLEYRMEAVNSLYVPALKALNQVESSLFLLESDLDKSLHEGILRPKDNLESVLNSRLDFVARAVREFGAEETLLANGYRDLENSYRALEATLLKVYQDWPGRAVHEAELSDRRADFRLRLKGLIRDLDRETRLVSIGVQSEISRLGILLTAIVGLCLMGAFLMAYGLARSLKPLEILARVLRSISERGLSEIAVRELAELPDSQDEIGTLSREGYKMASSLLDQNKLLQDQKQNLERAHLELAKQNVELKKTQTKLLHSEKLGLVGKMAAQMAHEIRNPLNALNLHAELLEDQVKQNTEAMESLEPLRKEINRLITVTESYLDLARAPRLATNPLELNDLVEELHDLYEPLFREKGIHFTCDLGEIPPVAADKGQLAQVLGNLLKNAAEALESKQEPRFVRLITQFNAEKSEALLTVMDNGAGIPEESQQHVFSPFFTSKAQGTGLGLAHSKQVVEELGGEINFESHRDRGTKFTLRMPVLN
jgi:signal transduction histidine kinase